MKTQRLLALGCLALALSSPALAQFRKEYTPQYLRAALGSVRHNTTMSVTGEFDAALGLRDMEEYLDGDAYSRFTIKDPETAFEFTSMYCEHGSTVFKTLLSARGRKVYTFHGQRQTGDDQEDAFFATRVIFVREIKPKPEKKPPPTTDGALRVVITDSKTGQRTVVANVVKGQPYEVDNLTVVVEDEPSPKP